MSKLDIGVGDEFPLDESRPEEGRRGWRGGHRGHGHHHHHHHHRHVRHGHRRGLLHLPLFLAVAATAALIGAGKIPALATAVILAVAAVAILLAAAAHYRFHRRWHADQRTS